MAADHQPFNLMEESQADNLVTYDRPSLVVIGPVAEFTFGSKDVDNDGANTKKKRA